MKKFSLIKKIIARTGLYSIIVLALFASSLRLFSPLLADYKQDFETYLSNIFKSKIKVNSIKVTWLGLTPVVELDNISALAANERNKIFSLNKLAIGINISQSIYHWRLQPGLLYIDGAKINIVKTKQDKYLLKGLSSSFEPGQMGSDQQVFDNVTSWLIKQDKVRLKNIKLAYKSSKFKFEANIQRLKLINDESGHHFEGTLFLNNALNSKIRVIGHLKGSTLKTFSGKYYLSVNRLPLKLLNEFHEIPYINFAKGFSSVELWGDLNKNFKLDGQAIVRLENLRLNKKENSLKKIKISYLSGRVGFRYDKKNFSFYGNKFRLSPFGARELHNNFLIKRENKKFIIQASHIPLRALQKWWHFFALKDISLLNRSHFHGILRNFQLTFYNKKPVLLFTDFNNIGWHDYNNLSINELSGHMYLDSSNGYLNLDSNRASISLPHPYNLALSFNKLKGIYKWKKLNGFWRVTSDNSVANFDDISLASHFIFDWHGSLEQSYLDYDASLSGNNIEELKPYLSDSYIKKKLYNYLTNSIVSVPKLDGHIKVKGKLGDFPYQNKDGIFQINLYAHDAIMKFHKDWPKATHLDTRLVINKQDLIISASHGKLGGNKFSDVKVLISPLAEHVQHLYLMAHGELDTQKALEYIIQSPLNNKLKLLQYFSFKGKQKFDLELTIPLYPENNKNKVNGKIDFIENEILYKQLKKLKLNKLSGAVYFDEQGIKNSIVDASLFKHPVKINLGHKIDKGKDYLVIDAGGKMSIQTMLDKFFPVNLKDLVGVFNYSLSCLIPKDESSAEFSFSSDLLGVNSFLPDPLSKKSLSKIPLNINGDYKNNLMNLNIDLNSKVKAVTKVNFNNEKWLDAVIVAVNRELPKLTKPKGLYLTGKLSKFSLTPWMDWYSNHIPKGSSKENIFNNAFIDVDIASLRFNQYQLNNFQLQYYPRGNNKVAKMKNNIFSGVVTLPTDYIKSGFDVRLDYLNLKSNNKGMNSKVNPNDIPPFKADIQKLTYNNLPLGHLKFKAIKTSHGLLFNDISFMSKDYQAEFVSKWTKKAGKSSTEIKGYIQTFNLANLLKRFNTPPVVNSHRATLKINFKSNNDFPNLNLTNIRGNAQLELNRGKITKLSPDVERKLGLGKLISILSLQTLPRRLVLDFSDLSGKGFSFDSFKGDFNLKNGILSTKNSRLNGPVASVNMQGQLDINKHLYNLYLKVTPHVTASLPVVATIAGGPIAGVATWVASKILSQGVSQVTGYSYKITGPWLHPVVHQLSISKVKTKR